MATAARAQKPASTDYNSASSGSESKFRDGHSPVSASDSPSYRSRAFRFKAGARVAAADGGDEEFASNAVVTSKYTALNFIPKNIYEQFRRVANIYFLIISLLQVLTNLSPTNKYATIIPLIGVLAVSMIKEMGEDFARHKADEAVNASRARVLRDGCLLDVAWAELRVGDFLYAQNRQGWAADVVLLASSDEHGVCYIETSGLDGESNLKIRQVVGNAVPPSLADNLDACLARLSAAEGLLRCDEPNADLYSFRASLQLRDAADLPVSLVNTAWRGSILRNTKWAIGLVVYTGQDSKLVQNSRAAPSKRSHVDRLVNSAINIIFLTLAILCTASTILYALWLADNDGAWYIYLGVTQTKLTIATTWITFLILYNNLVPISLYVSLELVKSFQGRLIQWDINMYSAELNAPALARTSNLNEDLGQIEYIFTDKTGTLTCNQMRFKRCSIGGVEYGKVSSGTNSAGFASPPAHSGRVTPTPATVTGASFASLSPKEQLAMTASLLPGHHASTTNLLAGFEPTGPESASNSGLASPPNHPASIGEAAQLLDCFSSRLLEAARSFPFKSQRMSMHVSASAVTPPLDESDSTPSPFVSVAISSSSSSSARIATAPAAPSHAWTEMAATETPAPAARQSADADASRHYDFDDDALIRALCDATQPAQARSILDFLLVMGVCHTAIPERDENGVVQYQAASPDEETLVIAARRLGVEFLSSSKRQARFRVFGVELVYDILNVNEFSSDRKRMSVVVRHPSGALVLYAKGADETIFPRLRAADKALAENVREHLSEFGSEGLRTLALSQSLLEPAVYQAWNERFEKAAISLEDREEKLRDLADEIETNLTLLGASAIEDRLQDGVPETIRALGDAGIKIWMLTGDKLETAINIGVSCRLLSKSMELLQLDEESLYLTSMKLASYLQTYQDSFGKTSDNLALIISGNSLLHIMNDSNMSRVFLELCRACKAVIACRLNPTQKAELVRMVKSASFQPLTLAIGDGANDVSMIQEAHIGIGIIGSEGMQAVRAADFAFGQFRFLQRLLLVHGRWNYKRVSMVILYSFYKNITLVLTLFYYGFSNGFSGTTLYESWLGAGWNVGWTLLPPLLFGVLDQDLRAATVLRNPKIYIGSARQSEFNMWRMALWVFNAVLHSLVIYIGCSLALASMAWAKDGRVVGLFGRGVLINCCAMLTVNMKIALHTSSWMWWNTAGIVLSVIAWFLFSGIYSSLMIGTENDFYGIASRLFVLPMFWLVIFTIPVAACIIDVAVSFIKRTYYPGPIDIAQEVDAEALAAEANAELPVTTKLVSDGGELVPTLDFEPSDGSGADSAEAAAASRNLISEPRAQMLHTHLANLRSILSGAAVSQKKELQDGVRHLSSQVGMHWLTLALVSAADGSRSDDLEREFHEQYVKKNIFFLRSAAAVIFGLMLFYSIITTLSGGDTQLVARWIVTGAALVVAVFMWTRLFRLYFSEFLFAMMIVGGIGKTVMITSSGVSGLALFAIVVFLVLRSRFFTSLLAALVDFAFYNIYIGLVQSNMSLHHLGFVDFLQACLIAFAAFHGYRMERSYRVDFLLQKDYVSEQSRTQKIVDNMLPTHITSKLKANEGKNEIIANSDESVSIIFCDITGFGQLMKLYEPPVLVAILDAIYSTFDELCEKHYVQKMETVGKTYMAAAGLQGTRRDHAVAAAEMAEEMIALMRTCVDSNGEPVRIRVGINTGTVISGVVGKKRQQFSLFGDTVNTSSRMQSTGLQDRIHVSEATAALLRADYALQSKQTAVKGKGTLTTYLVADRKSAVHKTRRHSIIKKEDDMIDEIPKFVRMLEARDNDADEEIDSVPMDRYSLTFPELPNKAGALVDFEALYIDYRKLHIANEVRVPLALAIFFFIVESLLEWNMNPDSMWAIFAARLAFVVPALLVCALLLSEQFRQHFSEHARFYTTALFITGVVSTLVARLSYAASFEADYLRPMLTIILLTTLVCNSGIRFIDAIAFNALAVVIFCVAGFGFALQDSLSTMIVLLFWVVAGSTINLVSSYGRETYQRREFVLKTRVVNEKELADAFLYKMLPRTVAETLKSGQSGIADTFEDVTILYSDIQGFTSYAASSNPQNVVKLLSALFTQFDNLTTKHAVYKIQTIGDAYVIVSGFPFCTPRNPDADAASSADAIDSGAAKSPENLPAASALRMMHMAFDMISVIEGVRTAEGGRVRMRIGVHTGRLIAGCIGTKTLRYDIWGTDCLCSNTMESSGRPSCVVLSEATKVLIQDRIECAPFEVVNVKGMGDVQTYIVPVTSEAREEFLQYQSEKSAGGAAATSAAHVH